MRRWLGSAIEFGLGAASVAGFPLGEPGKLASSGYRLYEKVRENKRAAGLEDWALIGRVQDDILDGWLAEARGDWLTEADSKAADALLDRHLTACLPNLEDLAGLAGEVDRTSATVALAIKRLEAKDRQFRHNPRIRRFAEEVLTLVVIEVRARPEFQQLLVPYDIEKIAEVAARTEKKVDRLLVALEPGAAAEAAKAAGVSARAFVLLARKINLAVDDEVQALAELETAVAELAELQNQAKHGGNCDVIVYEALRRVADKARLGEFDAAAAEAGEAFDLWQQREAERREVERATGFRLIEANIEQQRFLRDAKQMVHWVDRWIALAADVPEAPLDDLGEAFAEWFKRGRDVGLNLDLEVAIEIGRLVLKRSLSPDERCDWQNKLGIALGTLGARSAGTERLIEAVEAFRQTLLQWTREHVPLQWAGTQNNLGTALSSLGAREAGTQHLFEAVDAFRQALLESTRERVPLDWAMTQNNLGNALSRLGERKAGTRRLRQAVTAYHQALLEWTRERMPLEWAGTYNDLGNALTLLGEREDSTERLLEAVDAYHHALSELTRERAPLDWAMTQSNLGNALRSLGEREAGIERLKEAVTAYHQALLERSLDRVPPQWAGTTLNLCLAEALIAERSGNLSLLADCQARAVEARQQLINGAHREWAGRADLVLQAITRARVAYDAPDAGHQSLTFDRSAPLQI